MKSNYYCRKLELALFEALTGIVSVIGRGDPHYWSGFCRFQLGKLREVANPSVLRFVWLAMTMLGGAGTGWAADFEAGPLVHEFKLTLSAGDRVEAVGPLLSYEKSDVHEQWALSPFLTCYQDWTVDSEEVDFLYPFMTYDRFGEEYKLRFFMLTTFSGGRKGEGLMRRYTFFPFFFGQWTGEGEVDYMAVFPIAGTIRERLNRDEIRFLLFPLYSQTRKADVVTSNYLYPIFHLRRGEGGLHGWQFWPIAGYEEKPTGQTTNDWGELEVVPGHRTSFVLWPLYFDHRIGLGTTNPVVYRVFFPFHVRQRSPGRDATSWMWPLYTYTDDRAQGYRQWDTPWPLIVVARGEGKTVNRVFPFYSRARSQTMQSDFILWPVYKFNRSTSTDHQRERMRILFFLYSRVEEGNPKTGEMTRRYDLWPFFTRRVDAEGRERTQLLSVLEPLLPRNDTIERNFSPLWAIWRSEKDPTRSTQSQSLLWNLYRRDVMPGSRKWSALFGLFRYEAGEAGKRLSLFYLPVLTGKRGSEQSSR